MGLIIRAIYQYYVAKIYHLYIMGDLSIVFRMRMGHSYIANDQREIQE